MISDVHLGDGSSKDHMIRGDRERLLHAFLDQVEACGARLIVLGDLIDLWRFRLDAVLERWGGVLDRLDALSAEYVPGNHDVRLQDDPSLQRWHPLFQRLCEPFTEQIGERRFRFMHGHEVDPFIPNSMDRWGHVLGWMSGIVRFRPVPSVVAQDAMTDAMLEWGESFLHLWHRTLRTWRDQIQWELFHLPDHNWRKVKAPLRTQKMLSRFYRHRGQGLYDVAVTGHTHVAGHFSHWYLNCGCWTKSHCSFLKIESVGKAEVFDWRKEGEQRMHACVWTRCLT